MPPFAASVRRQHAHAIAVSLPGHGQGILRVFDQGLQASGGIADFPAHFFQRGKYLVELGTVFRNDQIGTQFFYFLT